MNRIKNICAGMLLATAVVACTDNFEATNTNPNKMTVGDIKAYGMFEPLLYNGASAWQNYTWYWNNELVQFTAFTGGVTREEHRYKIADGDWKSVWNKYASMANNAIHMKELAEEQDVPAVKAVALTLKVLYLSNLTDMFGDIPYSEAFKAREGGTLKPVFDSQKEVYRQMFEELEQANDLYAGNPVFEKTGIDGMYGGDMQKWRKFNNSLYLRLLCRVSGRSEMGVSTKMTEILNNASAYPIFASNADNATVKFTGADPYVNYFGNTLENNFSSSGRKLAQQFIKMTVVTENGAQTYVDPRLPIFGKKNPSTGSNPKQLWIGTVAGCTREEMSEVDKGTSWLNAAVFCRGNAPADFMDYAEVQFILAEAALKGTISGGASKAKEYYEAGVKASMEKWAPFGAYSETPVTITEDDITMFLSSALGSWDNASDKTALIAHQKFLALFWIGMEPYHEIRRTGYPELTIGGGTTYNDFTFPTRFGYNATTLATNYEHTMEALTRMGGANDMKTPVWWSKQAIAKGN